MADSFDQKRMDGYFKGDDGVNDEKFVQSVFCSNDFTVHLRSLMFEQFSGMEPEDKDFFNNSEDILHKIHYQINTDTSESRKTISKSLIQWTLRIAGIILMIFSIYSGIYLYNDVQEHRNSWVEIKAPAWSRVRFNLPDGTTGWLNSNSMIKYSGDFNNNRNVQLSGEAFFDVSKDPKHPFSVYANNIHINVLGTKFNVSAYDEDNTVEVFLEEGMINYTNIESNTSNIMKPNDLIVYDKTLKTISEDAGQAEIYCSWIDGKLTFRNDSLDVIAKRLERWYNVEVEIDTALLDDIQWRATFIDESIEEVLSFLNKSFPIEYKVEEGRIQSDGTFTKKKVTIRSKK